MSHISYSRVLSWTTEPLTSLESITEVPDRQVTKTGKSSKERRDNMQVKRWKNTLPRKINAGENSCFIDDSESDM